MSVDSLTKRVARLEGDAPPSDRFLARLSEAELDEIIDAYRQRIVARREGIPAPEMSPATEAKIKHMNRLRAREETRQP